MEIEGRSYSEVLKSKKDETDQMENDTPKDKQLVLDTSKVPKAELHNGECWYVYIHIIYCLQLLTCIFSWMFAKDIGMF